MMSRKRTDEYLAQDLEDFVDWLTDCGEDAFYVFDDTRIVIDRYLKEIEE